MAVTIAPSAEALQAIVERISSGTAYELEQVPTYISEAIDPLEEVDRVRVDVVHESEEQLNETLAIEDRTSHMIRVWVRKQVASGVDDVDSLRLLTRQIFQRLNDYDTTDRRVRVWECDMDSHEIPHKEYLREASLFVASILLRVEVDAS